ncbi:MAG: glutaredoxin family protein [Spirochaetia bacterium]
MARAQEALHACGPSRCTRAGAGLNSGSPGDIVGSKGRHVEFQRVEGTDKGTIVLYTLSTCMWCRMAKNLLKDLGVCYDYVDVDTLPAEEKDAVKKEIKKWNPDGSYPTLVINNKECVSGFDEAEIREKIK